MKSFWEKATEIGTKAKSLATGYLGTEKQPRKDIDEQEKNFGEKFLTLKTEIDEFKRDTIKAAEEKLRAMADKVKVSSQEREMVQKNMDEQVLNLEASFCEKEKNYLLQINDFEKKIKFKDLHIEKLENSVKELKEEIKGCKINFNFMTEKNSFIYLRKDSFYFSSFSKNAKIVFVNI